MGFTCYATSAMNDRISQSIKRSCPFSGVAIFVRKHIAYKITVIKLASSCIILNLGTILLIMVALWNRADHYIYIMAALWNIYFCLVFSFFLFFLYLSFLFPRLISAAADRMSTILPRMVWL